MNLNSSGVREFGAAAYTQFSLGEVVVSNISNVVTTITKVADQTNLRYSQHTRSEAEKSRRYGAGFAVVAQKFAKTDPAVAALEIEQMVRDAILGIYDVMSG